MKNYALLLFGTVLTIANFGCDKCEGIDCTTPAPNFTFQLLDKDSGEDLVANGSFEAKEVTVFSLADNKPHSLLVSASADSTAYFFTDQQIGWEAGPENASFELRLSDSTAFSFTYLTKEEKDGCCTAIKLDKFEIEGVEQSFFPVQDLFQLRL